jgi:hypothetical protein
MLCQYMADSSIPFIQLINFNGNLVVNRSKYRDEHEVEIRHLAGTRRAGATTAFCLVLALDLKGPREMVGAAIRLVINKHL